eukprot:scaffold78886_cov57-Phaeocystis_antarctica.AAC.1
MAGAGVPVLMDDGTAIAAAPEIVCPLPGVARSAQKWPWFFLLLIRPPRFVPTEGGRECGAKMSRFAEGSGKRRKIWPRGWFGLIFGAKPHLESLNRSATSITRAVSRVKLAVLLTARGGSVF